MLAFAMPAGFTPAQIEALAALAHLELTAPEIDRIGRQLGDILEYARQVQQFDTDGVPPTATVASEAGRDRDDEVKPSLDRLDVLANAPDAAEEAGLFKVPQVIG